MKNQIKEKELELWQEIVGERLSIEEKAGTSAAILRVQTEALEAEAIQNLETNFGQKTAILKTGNPSQPNSIRTLSDTTIAHNFYCTLQQFRTTFLLTSLNAIAFKFPLQQFGLR
ncbi:MAG: hypothetical protein ABSF44_08755 [Candidatus Bathyarchaeia archaeon]|jgi:hypothetical protein